MPKTATAYLYEELGPEAQKNALDNCRGWNVEYCEWYDLQLEEEQEDLGEKGFVFEDDDRHKISFSGFSSQGDGASFTCAVDLVKFLEAHDLANDFRSLYFWAKRGYTYGRITRTSHHYSHEMTMGVELHLEPFTYPPKPCKAECQIDDVEKIVLEKAREYARGIYRDLEKTFWALREDDVVANSLIANDVYFWENGTLANAPSI